MSGAIWMGLAVVAAAFILKSLLTSNIDRAMRDAVQRDSISPIVEAIEAKPEDSRVTLLNHTLKRLWESYHRELAARLVRQMAPALSGASITHYWIQKCLEVEPEMSSEHLDMEFLVEHYRPDLAAGCGAAG